MTTEDDRLDADVAIIGYGPVGNVLAILLAQRGHRVVVLERWPQPYGLPRAVHLDDEAARIVQACGLGRELQAITEPAAVYEWRNADGTPLLRIDGGGLGPSGWPRSSMFCQPELEEMLGRRAGELPGIEVRRGAEAVGIATVTGQAGTASPDGNADVVVTYGTVEPALDGPASGGRESAPPETKRLRARYVVGCDGANSTTRGLMGVPVKDLGFFYDWLIVDVVLHDRDRIFDPINLQVCDPARPTTAVSGGPGRRRWEFMCLPDEDSEQMNDEATAWRLLAPWDVTPANATLERHATYRFQARWAEVWRRGPVLLAGDAAHQMPPFAGQGLCAGLRDAASLAWRLDLVLGGHAPEQLLDTYGTERTAQVAAAIDMSMQLGEVICVPDPGAAAERDRAMTIDGTNEALREPPPQPGLASGFCRFGSVGAGQVSRQGYEASAAGIRFDDCVPPGWRLITRPGAVGALDDRDWFESIGGTVVSVGAGGDVDDPGGAYTEWLVSLGAVAVLERPDFRIYGGATDSPAAQKLLTDLRRHLGAPAQPPGDMELAET